MQYDPPLSPRRSPNTLSLATKSTTTRTVERQRTPRSSSSVSSKPTPKAASPRRRRSNSASKKQRMSGGGSGAVNPVRRLRTSAGSSGSLRRSPSSKSFRAAWMPPPHPDLETPARPEHRGSGLNAEEADRLIESLRIPVATEANSPSSQSEPDHSPPREQTFERALYDVMVRLEALTAQHTAVQGGAYRVETVEGSLAEAEHAIRAKLADDLGARPQAYLGLSQEVLARIEDRLFPHPDESPAEIDRRKSLEKDTLKHAAELREQVIDKDKELNNSKAAIQALQAKVLALSDRNKYLEESVSQIRFHEWQTNKGLLDFHLEVIDFKKAIDVKTREARDALKKHMGFVPRSTEKKLNELQALQLPRPPTAAESQEPHSNSNPPLDEEFDGEHGE